MIGVMHYGTAFLSDPYFYYLLIIGVTAMLPRARYAAERAAEANPTRAEMIRPTMAQRLCLFIPGLCVFAAVALLRYVTGAAVLLVIFLIAYAAMIVLLRGPRDA